MTTGAIGTALRQSGTDNLGLVRKEWRVQRMIRYLVPEQCIYCGTAGQVTLTARTPRGAVAICWHCEECHGMWPIKQSEQLDERRSAPGDRRRLTRADRRGRKTLQEE
jgi:hypothetical protein